MMLPEAALSGSRTSCYSVIPVRRPTALCPPPKVLSALSYTIRALVPHVATFVPLCPV